MARTTEAEVRLMARTDPAIELDVFIDTASFLVDQVVTCATDKGITFTSGLLQKMEALIASHLYHLRDQRYKSKKTGDAAASYFDDKESETYWAMAKALDTSGCLKAFEENAGAIEVAWLGKPVSAQIDYVDRD
jgi:hypothetical protein